MKIRRWMANHVRLMAQTCAQHALIEKHYTGETGSKEIIAALEEAAHDEEQQEPAPQPFQSSGGTP